MTIDDKLPTLLFLDTEFTDFIDCELISLGIVSEDGREFYCESTDFEISKCSDFVKAAVIPLLRTEPAVIGNEATLSSALNNWLMQFAKVEICIDYSLDFELFAYLCRNPEDLLMPPWIKMRNIANDLSPQTIEHYWKTHGRKAHHALHDARANRFAYLERDI